MNSAIAITESKQAESATELLLGYQGRQAVAKESGKNVFIYMKPSNGLQIASFEPLLAFVYTTRGVNTFFSIVLPSVKNEEKEPVITRWDTWIDSAIYYCIHFQMVQHVIETLNPDDATAIDAAKTLFSNSEIEGQLAFVKANFSCLTQVITHVQEKSASLENSLALVNKIACDLKSIVGKLGRTVSKQVEGFLDNSSGYKTLCHISQVLTGETFDTACIEEDHADSDLVHFKYAAVVSADVERSFSEYKNLLSDNRCSLTFKNVCMLLVTYCNNSE